MSIELREQRVVPLSEIEVREDGPEAVTFTGYAAVFDTETSMGPFREKIAPGAFKRSIRNRADVRLLVNHDGVPIARTKSKTLRLAEDDHGLRVEADLDPSNPVVQELRSAMGRGDLDQMSFAFQTIKDDWEDFEDGTSLRTLREVKLFDVSAVTYPAYEETLAELRARAEALLEVRNTMADDPESDPDELTPAQGPEPVHSDALVLARNLRRRFMARIPKKKAS